MGKVRRLEIKVENSSRTIKGVERKRCRIMREKANDSRDKEEIKIYSPSP